MELTWAETEMAGAKVWDARCRRSLVRICAALAARPLTSFSAACGPALRQAAHRIFAHSTTSVPTLLQGHFAETQQRATDYLAAAPAAPAAPPPWLLVVQDTTVVDYSGHRATQGLGPIGNEVTSRGLFAHAALAVPEEGPPLGVVHLSLWARDPAQHGRCRDENAAKALPADEKESRKWRDGLRGAEAALGPDVPFLLVQDREGDVFDFLTAPRQAHTHLLIRAAHPRQILLAPPPLTHSEHQQRREACSLWEGLEQATVCGTMEVLIPRAPGRPERTATLELRILEAWILPPRVRTVTAATKSRQPAHVWVVQARELDPPAETPPVCWVLLCTLPVESTAQAARLVRAYRRRWMIEQLHLVLKSGLRIERLQFDDAASLQHALALCYVVAWRVLYARDLARCTPAAPAAELVSPLERQVLEAVEGRPLPTVREALRAVAHLAGFPRYPSAGEPGVKSLWEGFRRLEGLLLGWQLARAQLGDMRQD